MAAADFNGDGIPDLVCQNLTAGAAQIWYMGGSGNTTVLSYTSIAANPPWRIMAAADFNGDLVPDLVWQLPSSGAVQISFMGGSGGSTSIGTATVTSSNPWTFVAAPVFPGGGYPDLAWQNPSTGLVQYWWLNYQ